MPLLSQNKILDSHKIEGIGDDFIPKIVQKNIIDKIIPTRFPLAKKMSDVTPTIVVTKYNHSSFLKTKKKTLRFIQC